MHELLSHILIWCFHVNILYQYIQHNTHILTSPLSLRVFQSLLLKTFGPKTNKLLISKRLNDLTW